LAGSYKIVIILEISTTRDLAIGKGVVERSVVGQRVVAIEGVMTIHGAGTIARKDKLKA
jgi:hypothetical protein